MKSWRPTRHTIVVLVLVSSLFLLMLLSKGFYPSSNRMTRTTFSINNGKYIQIMLREYADEHDGHMPDTLHELSPTYLPRVQDWGFCYDNTEPRHYCDWLYFRRPSLSQAPPKSIMLAAPWAIKEAPLLASKRVIILFDGGYELLPENEFQTRVAKELRQQHSVVVAPDQKDLLKR